MEDKKDIIEEFIEMKEEIECKTDEIIFIGAILSNGTKICCEKDKVGDILTQWIDDKPWKRKKTLTQAFVETEALDRE